MTVPSCFSARLWYIPPAMATTLLNPGGTSHCPFWLSPQAQTVPSGVRPPFCRSVNGDDSSLIAHFLGDVRRLAARRGAGVEHRFAGLWIEQVHGEQRARILHVEVPGLKGRQFFDGNRRRNLQA